MMTEHNFHLVINLNKQLKGIVQFEMNFWYVLAYLKGIQDVGCFHSSLNFDIF